MDKATNIDKRKVFNLSKKEVDKFVKGFKSFENEDRTLEQVVKILKYSWFNIQS